MPKHIGEFSIRQSNSIFAVGALAIPPGAIHQIDKRRRSFLSSGSANFSGAKCRTILLGCQHTAQFWSALQIPTNQFSHRIIYHVSTHFGTPSSYYAAGTSGRGATTWSSGTKDDNDSNAAFAGLDDSRLCNLVAHFKFYVANLHRINPKKKKNCNRFLAALMNAKSSQK